MNDIGKPLEDSRHNDDALFDRLVDGELSSDEYRQLLASLDDEPGGWRRCALAFLESQALRGSFAQLLPSTNAVERGTVNVSPTAPASQSRFSRWSVAAMVLAGFGLGAMLSDFAVRFDGVSTVSPVYLAKDGDGSSALATDGAPRDVKVVFDLPDATQREIAVPIVDPQRLTDGAGWNEQPLFPEDLLRALRRQGHDVSRTRSLMPVPLQDGRGVVVPVEQIQITPVSRKVY